MLLRKFYMCSTEVKLTLLRTFCSPMYTAQLWCNYTVASIHNLHVSYNTVFHLLLNQPKYCSSSTMFVEYHVPDSKAVIRNLVYKFMQRLDDWSKRFLSPYILCSALCYCFYQPGVDPEASVRGRRLLAALY